jgi:hypothetical protein
MFNTLLAVHTHMQEAQLSFLYGRGRKIQMGLGKQREDSVLLVDYFWVRPLY